MHVHKQRRANGVLGGQLVPLALANLLDQCLTRGAVNRLTRRYVHAVALDIQDIVRQREDVVRGRGATGGAGQGEVIEADTTSKDALGLQGANNELEHIPRMGAVRVVHWLLNRQQPSKSIAHRADGIDAEFGSGTGCYGQTPLPFRPPSLGALGYTGLRL